MECSDLQFKVSSWNPEGGEIAPSPQVLQDLGAGVCGGKVFLESDVLGLGLIGKVVTWPASSWPGEIW